MRMTTIDLSATSDLFRLLSDPSRLRLLALLEQEEITVAELVRLTGLMQSRVSSHLARLREAGFVVDRRHGASTFYRLNESGMGAAARKAFDLLVKTTRDPLLEADQQALRALIRRRGGDETWADAVAGEMDRHYSPGRSWEAAAWGALGLARLGRVLDVASGDGVLAELLAPRARRVTCLDLSAKVMDAGRRRLSRLRNVEFVRGDMHQLPFADGSFDQALLMHGLTYSKHPERAFAELSRVLVPGAPLVAVTLRSHEHQDVLSRFNHVRLGFEPRRLEQLLERAGFVVDLCRVTSRERRRPHFDVITVHAQKVEKSKRRTSR